MRSAITIWLATWPAFGCGAGGAASTAELRRVAALNASLLQGQQLGFTLGGDRSEALLRRWPSAVSTAAAAAGPTGGFVPRWNFTYNMTLSTVVMPCDDNELMSKGPNWPTIRRFGLIDIDWSNSKAEWINTDPMTCEENLLKQAELIKQNNPLGQGQKIWVYRNPVLAMPWMSSTRKILDDPAYESWFLRFKNGSDGRSAVHHDRDGTYHNPVCDRTYDPPKCSNLFHSQIQTMEVRGPNATNSTGMAPPDRTHKHWWEKSMGPDGHCKGRQCNCGRVPCGMYLFDHRQGDTKVCTGWGGCMTLKDWFTQNLTVTPTGLLSPAIDGFYIDDMWPDVSNLKGKPWPPVGDGPWNGGAGDLSGSEIPDCGLSFQDSMNLYTSWVANMQPMVKTILDHKGFIWQMTNGGSDAVWRAVSGCTSCNGSWKVESQATCASTLREACSATSKQQLGALNYQITLNKTTGAVDPHFHQHLASFLLMRGKFAWFGYGWVGCSRPYTRPPELDTDYGSPLELCHETAPSSGIFERQWSKAHVKMDCNTWTGTISPKAATLPLKLKTDEAAGQSRGPPVPGPGCGRLNNPSPGPTCGRCLSSGNSVTWAKCGPGHDHCGRDRNESAGRLRFHIQDLSCKSSDTDFPFYDGTHGVYHLMYQRPSPKNASGHYQVAIGHVVSRNLVHWAHMPVSLWPDHQYDSMDIFTGTSRRDIISCAFTYKPKDLNRDWSPRVLYAA